MNIINGSGDDEKRLYDMINCVLSLSSFAADTPLIWGYSTLVVVKTNNLVNMLCLRWLSL